MWVKALMLVYKNVRRGATVTKMLVCFYTSFLDRVVTAEHALYLVIPNPLSHMLFRGDHVELAVGGLNRKLNPYTQIKQTCI